MSLQGDILPARGSEDFLQNCVDLDAHEMAPIQCWPEIFGEEVQEFVALCERGEVFKNNGSNTIFRPDLVKDEMAIDTTSVWQQRGPAAPSAFDLSRRDEVMSVMGVERQLVYPGYGLVGTMLAYHPFADSFWGIDKGDLDMVSMAKRAVRIHNDWCLRMAAKTGSKIRPVAILLSHSLGQMMEDAKALIAGGCRAIMLPVGVPPAGLSPADAALDPLWDLFASSNVPLTFHLGTEFPLLRDVWDANVPAFEGAATLEINIQPYWGCTLHYASENFLTTMVLGGVLERHPNLRVGAIEVGANWIGPLAERIDIWAGQFKRRLDGLLSMKPSEYINRQVRVTPFHFEDVASYFSRFPHLENVYAFSTDYPHSEGGRDSKASFITNLTDTSERIQRKFFRENGLFLMPD